MLAIVEPVVGSVDDTDLNQLLTQAISLQQQRTSRYEEAALDALSNVRAVITSLAVLAWCRGAAWRLVIAYPF